MQLKNIGLAQKIMGIITVAFVLSGLVSTFMSGKALERRANEELVAKSRAIAQMATNTREYVAMSRSEGLYDDKKLLDEVNQLRESRGGRLSLDEVRKTGFYKTVPVVAAWHAAEKEAEKSGYSFRVPAFDPRNPENTPTDFEAGMLNQIKNRGLEEYHKIDRKANVLRYMKPVVLSQDCMICHGDPKGGPDPIGFTKEGWKPGMIHGAFEIISDLGPLQADVNKTAFMNFLVMGICIALALGLLTVFLNQSLFGPVNQVIDVAKNVAEGDLTRSVPVASSDEVGKLATVFNSMTKSMNDVVKEIKSSTGSMLDVSKEFDGSSQRIADGAQQQSASFEQLSSSVQSNATNASSANGIIQGVAKECEVIGNDMNNVIESMHVIEKGRQADRGGCGHHFRDCRSDQSSGTERRNRGCPCG